MGSDKFFRGPTDYTSNESKLSEKKVESKSCDVARANGWYTRKWASPSHRGVPDRLFIKNGVVMLIEYKRVGNKPTALQYDDMEQIRGHGGKVYWANTVRGTKGILGIYT